MTKRHNEKIDARAKQRNERSVESTTLPLLPADRGGKRLIHFRWKEIWSR